MSYPLDMHGLEDRIGYRFKTPALLRTALTHSSFAHEQMGSREGSNERLEFLGDSVLSLIVCDDLYRSYPKLPEGKLTVIRKNLVCQEALTAYGHEIALGTYLLLGKGEEKDGREKPKLLEDAFEALLGAIYLDSGRDLARVAAFLLPLVRERLHRLETELVPMEDYKTVLQQYVQQTPGEELRYESIGEEGPDNAKVFRVRVLINSNEFGVGEGTSKKEAEQNAARAALQTYLPPK